MATLALAPLLLISLAGCSGATKEEMKEGLKENIVYQKYHINDDIWSEESIEKKKNSDSVNKLADCIVEAAYDDLSSSGRNTVASGSHDQLAFYDDDLEVMNRASDECGW